MDIQGWTFKVLRCTIKKGWLFVLTWEGKVFYALSNPLKTKKEAIQEELEMLSGIVMPCDYTCSGEMPCKDCPYNKAFEKYKKEMLKK